MQPVLQLLACTGEAAGASVQTRQAELGQENYPTAEFSHNIQVPVIPATATKTGQNYP